jgi:hypothetical protein
VGLYCEQQEGVNCGAHSLNALLGKGLVTSQSLRRLLEHQWPRNKLPLEQHDRADGFSLQALTFWLAKYLPGINAAFELIMQAGGAPQTAQHIKAQVQQRKATRLLIHHANHWHVVARSPRDHHWYRLDSVAMLRYGGIARMEEADWAALADGHHNVNVLTAADPIAAISDAGRQPPAPEWVEWDWTDIRV